jgi:Mlc titration factor MtfA (ptsG expression regulator)
VLVLFKHKRREKLRARPLSAEQRATVRRNVAFVSALSAEDQRELEGHVQVFLAEKTFEGCGGLAMTDEIKLTIAAQACVLLLHRETDYYPGLESILVYPNAYVVKNTRQKLGNVVVEGDEVRLGESWVRGAVVLAWDAVKRGASNCHDGHNVVLHEFSHQLDAEDGAMNGAPDLGKRSLYSAWAHALGAEYEELLERVAAHQPSDIDAYGAISPAEFFAVVTEAFFETGAQLERRHPELYEVLRAFYRQDPAGAQVSDRRAPEVVGVAPLLAGRTCQKLLCLELWDGAHLEAANGAYILVDDEWHHLYFDTNIVFWRSGSTAPVACEEDDSPLQERLRDLGRELGVENAVISELSARRSGSSSEVELGFAGGRRVVFIGREDDSTVVVPYPSRT